MSSKVVLITGANRGIGKGLVSEYLLRPNHTVIAAVRNPEDASSKELISLNKADGSSIVVVKIDASSETDPAAAVQELEEKHNISHVDVVLAVAGIGRYFGIATGTPASEVRDHFEVNALGPLLLFQAFAKLLQASKKPVFVAVTTGLGSLGAMEHLPMPVTAYGASKAALNYIVRKIHFENKDWLIAFPINPGWVQTDMGNAGAVSSGMKEAPVTLKDSVNGIIGKIDKAAIDASLSGTFQSFDDEQFPW